MIVRADNRLALLAPAKLAGVGAAVGLVVGMGMTLDGESPWSLVEAPLLLSVMSACSLGAIYGLIWWLGPGLVSYSVTDTHLIAHRGTWQRAEIPLGRIEKLAFDEEIEVSDLVLRGWTGYVSPIPALRVELTVLPDRWDPSSGAEQLLPGILLCGERQRHALRALRASIDANKEESPR